jgi:CRP-like cAMP-binding protein
VELIDHHPSTPMFFEARSYTRELRILRRCIVFATLDDASELRALASHSTTVTVDRRKNLGTVGDGYLYVIGSGRVRMMEPDADRELTLEYLGPGDLVGDTALWSAGLERRAIVVEQAEALRIPLSAVRQLLATNAAFCSAMLMVVGQRRLTAEHRLHALLSRTVESRVAEFLVMAAERHGIPDSRGTLIGVKYTHQEIASYVGSTRETVTLILGDFKRADIVTTDHRRVVIRDPAGLKARC